MSRSPNRPTRLDQVQPEHHAHFKYKPGDHHDVIVVCGKVHGYITRDGNGSLIYAMPQYKIKKKLPLKPSVIKAKAAMCYLLAAAKLMEEVDKWMLTYSKGVNSKIEDPVKNQIKDLFSDEPS